MRRASIKEREKFLGYCSKFETINCVTARCYFGYIMTLSKNYDEINVDSIKKYCLEKGCSKNTLMNIAAAYLMYGRYLASNGENVEANVKDDYKELKEASRHIRKKKERECTEEEFRHFIDCLKEFQSRDKVRYIENSSYTDARDVALLCIMRYTSLTAKDIVKLTKIDVENIIDNYKNKKNCKLLVDSLEKLLKEKTNNTYLFIPRDDDDRIPRLQVAYIYTAKTRICEIYPENKKINLGNIKLKSVR